MEVKNAKELGQAIKDGKDVIELEAYLAKKVIKIKATGNVAWGVAAGALAVAITTSIISITTAPIDVATLGTTSAFKALVGTSSFATAATTLGSATSTALSIGIAGGGIGALNKLRNYRIENKNNGKIILHKK